MQDVSGRADEFSLDTSGFCYTTHASAIENGIMSMSDAEIEKEYYPETAALIKKL